MVNKEVSYLFFALGLFASCLFLFLAFNHLIGWYDMATASYPAMIILQLGCYGISFRTRTIDGWIGWRFARWVLSTIKRNFSKKENGQ